MLWCDKSFILLNVAKTKDVSIDFRKSSSAVAAMSVVKREEIELLEQNKYSGTALDNNVRNKIK